MKAKEFIDEVESMMIKVSQEQFEIMYHTAMSKFLYGFRGRHSGDYENHQRLGLIDRYRIWRMTRNTGLNEVKMEITNISTVVDRSVLLEIANIVISEVNDALVSRYGKQAILHDHIHDPREFRKQ